MPEFDLELVRYKLHQKMPYLRRVIWAIRPIKEEGLGTFGVDALGRMFYDDTVPWTVDEQVAVFFHEINHLIRDHHGRLGSKDPMLWNIAGDAEINDDLDDWGLPQGCILPSFFGMANGLTAEEYYNQGAEKLQQLKQKMQAEAEKDGKDYQPGKGQCGGVAGGHEPHGSSDGGGEVTDEDGNPVKGMSEAGKEALRQELAKDIKEASKTRGTVPGGLEAWANSILNPVVPWQKVLAGHVKRALNITSGGATDYTFSRPARRDTRPWIRPKAISRKPEVAIVIDTSGSVSDKMLAQFMGEITGIFKATAQTVSVLFVDAYVHGVQKVSTSAQTKLLRPKGRGGTDMRVGIEGAMKLRPKPNIIITLTDGYTPWPDHEPGDVRLIAAIMGGGTEGVPEWMKVVHIDES